MEDSRLLQQLHPPLPPGEGLVLRCGRGAGGVPRQNNVSRNIFPEFGPPPMLAADNSENPARLMRSNSFTGRIPPQHGPLEPGMQNYNNMDQCFVPFEPYAHHPQQQQCMPYNLTPPSQRYHPQYQQRRFGQYLRSPRFSRSWHQRRGGTGFRPPPPSPEFFYGHQNPGDCISSPPHHLQFFGDLENFQNHDSGRRISYLGARRHSDPLFNQREERFSSLPLMSRLTPPYFNHNDEEYVPEEVSVVRVRRVRLASLETLPDSTSSSNNSLPDEDEELTQEEKDCEGPEEENGDVFAEPTPAAEEDAIVVSDNMDCTRMNTAYLASATKYVLVGKQKTELRASFGVWMGNGNSNFGLLPLTRLQCHKAALIYGGAECVNVLKMKGFDQLKISESEDYLAQNIGTWLSKANAENGFILSEASNWDEVKYAEEIGQLCRALDGIQIDWVHLTGKCEGMEEAKRLAHAAMPKDYIVENSTEDLLTSHLSSSNANILD